MSAEIDSKAACSGASSRRTFLKGAAGAGVSLLAPGVILYTVAPEAAAQPAAKAANPKVRWGLLVDLNKCPRDCKACVTACADENGWDTGTRPIDAQWIRKVSVRDPRTNARQELPFMCQHCASPPCVDVCPTGASFKRADGIVLVDKHICIGCRYCMMACPYKGRSFVHETVAEPPPNAPRGKGTVESCTLCVHRIDAGRIPACVEACASRGGSAMVFGDMNDPSSAIAKAIATHRSAKIRADLGLDPAVQYVNL